MDKRNIPNSPRLLELKRRRHRVFQNKIIFSFLGILLVFILLAYVSRIPRLNISAIEITGSKVTDPEQINEAVKNDISGKYLWVFPKTNIFIFPEGKIINELPDNFKRLKDIRLSIKNQTVLEVSVTERTASYIWCGAAAPDTVSPPDQGAQKCYFLDKDGYIFEEAAYFSGDVYFKFYGLAGPSGRVPSGSYFFPEIFSKLISFKDTLQNMSLKPEAAYMTEDGDIYVYLYSETASAGPRIMLRADSDFLKVAENLEAALTTEPLLSEMKNKYSSLEYIDLRYGNKVYYKFSK